MGAAGLLRAKTETSGELTVESGNITYWPA